MLSNLSNLDKITCIASIIGAALVVLIDIKETVSKIMGRSDAIMDCMLSNLRLGWPLIVCLLVFMGSMRPEYAEQLFWMFAMITTIELVVGVAVAIRMIKTVINFFR